ncbi:MAG TPA: class I SAM-dependent methyltransferase [Jatrophihabitans sp.]|nr:class I SAM-dependent methyltransferase [Jatrophihabitans sp.]
MTAPLAPPADLDAVRDSYDRVADNYVALNMGDLRSEPWLRAALAAFAENARSRGPVLDVGCGPGHVTAHLAELGLDVAGVDLSPRMIEHARRRFPALRFDVASATAFEVEPGSLGGILGWWSLFNLPRDLLPAVLARFAAALAPGGHALIGTHVGDGDVPRTECYGGVPVRWTTHLWQPEQLTGLLAAAGLQPQLELRFPATPPSGRPQVLISAHKPERT